MAALRNELEALGARSVGVEADLSRPEEPAAVLARVGATLGPVQALVMCHCESVDSGILDTTVESFDLHMAVNARATWLLVRAFAEQFVAPPGVGRIVAFTSDHVVGNVPYGASKGALDRIVLAAATELSPPRCHCQRREPRRHRHRVDERRDHGAGRRGHPRRSCRPPGGRGEPRRVPLLAPRRVGERPAALERRRPPPPLSRERLDARRDQVALSVQTVVRGRVRRRVRGRVRGYG